jgi:hypothetical protein
VAGRNPGAYGSEPLEKSAHLLRARWRGCSHGA